jgi:hypothetical protein
MLSLFYYNFQQKLKHTPPSTHHDPAITLTLARKLIVFTVRVSEFFVQLFYIFS